MTSDRIRKIHEGTAYPDSVSVFQALLQVWNECEQECSKREEEAFDAASEERWHAITEYSGYFTAKYTTFEDYLNRDNNSQVGKEETK